jgi:hypothetical protein
MTRPILGSIEGEYRRYKGLAERAIEQLTDEDLSVHQGEGNSVITIVRHLAGNFRSRFTDFPAADGEKPWRDRDREFEQRAVSRSDLMSEWNASWTVLFDALATLDDARLGDTVTIRGVPMSVIEALHRSLSHAAYHVGQIVFLAKELRGDRWSWLTIPPGGTVAYNRNPTREKPPSS